LELAVIIGRRGRNIKAKDADINNIQNNPAALQFNGNVVGTYKASVNVFGLQYQHTF